MEKFQPEQDYYKDRRPQIDRPLAIIENAYKQVVETSRGQLEVIEPGLKDLIDKIILEKPDVIVMLDKGARIFGTPLHRYLSDAGIEKQPEILFFNDYWLKRDYLEGENLNQEDLAKAQEFKDKKVFFIDETYSTGKGAAALKRLIDVANLDARYFALSVDGRAKDDGDAEFKNHEYVLTKQKHDQVISDIKKDSRFTINQQPVGVLFSKLLAKSYVTETDPGITRGRYELIPSEDVDAAYDYSVNLGPVPHARKSLNDPDGIGWKEYDAKLKTLNLEFVKNIKDEIYKTLKKVGPKQG